MLHSQMAVTAGAEPGSSQPGVKSFFWIFHVGGRAPNTWAIFQYFPKQPEGNIIKSAAGMIP